MSPGNGGYFSNMLDIAQGELYVGIRASELQKALDANLLIVVGILGRQTSVRKLLYSLVALMRVAA